MASQVALVVKNLPANAGDAGDKASIPELGRFPEGGHGSPLQYSCLENPTDRVAKSWTQLSTWHTSSRYFVRIIPQNFDIFMGGGELHVFLFCHVELHPII